MDHVRTNQYKSQFKGDTYKRVEIELSPGVWRTVFGITKAPGGYRNDTLSGYIYKNMAEVKTHAINILEAELAEGERLC